MGGGDIKQIQEKQILINTYIEHYDKIYSNSLLGTSKSNQIIILCFRLRNIKPVVLRVRAVTTLDSMRPLVILLFLCQDLIGKPHLLEGEHGPVHRVGHHNPVLTAEQEAEINKQIDLLTKQGRLVDVDINNIQLRVNQLCSNHVQRYHS